MIKEKTRECSVRVRSVQRNTDGEAQVFEIENKGRLSEREGVLYVLYEENTEETREQTEQDKETASVMSVKNLLKIEEKPLRVSLKKSGAVSWKMVFEEGKKSESGYGTPYGTFEIGAETECVTLKKERKKTSLQLLYALFMQGEKQADCRLELEII